MLTGTTHETFQQSGKQDAFIHTLKSSDSEWDDSFIFIVFKGKCECIDKGNYCSLKLTEHVLKVVEQIIDVINPDVVNGV